MSVSSSYSDDIERCLDTLHYGGVILFPTDTVWGIGCDATNEAAVEKVLQLKQRSQTQGLIILLANESELPNYVNPSGIEVTEIINQQQKPITIIYEGGKNVAPNILPEEKTLAIRIVRDGFCQDLIRRFGKPIVSTSANIHGQPTPQNFSEIDATIIRQVNYVVQHRRQDKTFAQPSSILKIKPDGSFETIRL